MAKARAELDCDRVDVAFLVDTSGSMNGAPWNTTIQWLEKMVDMYGIDGTNRRAALIQWHSYVVPNKTIYFEDGLDSDQMKDRIENLTSPTTWRTMGGFALSYAFNNLFHGQGNSSVYQVAVFLSDGMAGDDMLGPAQNFHDNMIHLTPVYVGNADNAAVAMEALTGQNLTYENKFFQVHDFHNLTSDDLIAQIADCNEQAHCVDKGCVDHWHGHGECVNINNQPWDEIKEMYKWRTSNHITNKLCGTTSKDKDCCLCMAKNVTNYCKDDGCYAAGGECIDMKSADLNGKKMDSINIGEEIKGTNGSDLCVSRDDKTLKCCQCYRRSSVGTTATPLQWTTTTTPMRTTTITTATTTTTTTTTARTTTTYTKITFPITKPSTPDFPDYGPLPQ